MMRVDGNLSGLAIGGDEDAVALVDAVTALEKDLRLEHGTLVRELTGMVRRRQRFAGLKREYDARAR